MGKIYMQAIYSKDGQSRMLYFTSFPAAQSFVAALIKVFGSKDSDNIVYIMSNAPLPGTKAEQYTFHD